MTKEEYLKIILINELKSVKEQHKKLTHNITKAHNQLNDSTLTDRRINFLNNYIYKTDLRLKELKQRFLLIQELIEEYVKEVD